MTPIAQHVPSSDTAVGEWGGLRLLMRNGMFAVQRQSKFQVRPLYLQVRDALLERIKDGERFSIADWADALMERQKAIANATTA